MIGWLGSVAKAELSRPLAFNQFRLTGLLVHIPEPNVGIFHSPTSSAPLTLKMLGHASIP